MGNIVITVESGSDIPADIAEKYGIHVVPMYVTFGNESKKDGSFRVKDIIDYYDNTGKIPKTSGSMPQDFTEAFEKIRRENPGKEILHLAYSAVTTCSYQSAVTASAGLEHIACVDTKHVSAGQSAVAVRVAEALEQHPEWTLREAADYAKKVSESVQMCFIPEKLSFLRAGGRVSNAAAMIGSILKIHPLIELKNGYLVATQKLRGKMSNIFPKLIEHFAQLHKLDKKILFLGYTYGTGLDVREAAEAMAKKLGFKRIQWILTGGVITTHGGPGAVEMAGYRSQV